MNNILKPDMQKSNEKEQFKRSQKIDAANRMEAKKKAKDTWREIGSRILKERIARHLSQEDCVNEFSDVPVSDKTTWSRYESGQKQIPIKLLYDIGKKWNLSMDMLFYGDDQNTEKTRFPQEMQEHLKALINYLM